MNKETRIKTFAQLGTILKRFLISPGELEAGHREILERSCRQAKAQNAWFTISNIEFALGEWGDRLKERRLSNWLNAYNLPEGRGKKIAVIMAGNIPLVGFHDFLCVLLSGHHLVAKLSSKDKILLPSLVQILISIEPAWKEKIQFEEGMLGDFDAIIATGSNNTARYFEYYFGNKPHIIRKNRNAVALLNGKETEEDLKPLGEDIFRYFGLGCRNVSKLLVPKEYDFDNFFKAIYPWKNIINHHRYGSNYDYNKAVYLMSEFELLENGFLLLKETPGEFSSPLAVLFYEFYEDEERLLQKLEEGKEAIQCVVSHKGRIENSRAFGESQHPRLDEYADGVDTMEFLVKI